jgi:large conductance mechanosensitive channel
MLKEFKKFVLRGNAVDLVVGVMVGAALGAVVTAVVKDVLTPLVAAIAGKPDFSNIYFTINGSRLMYGDVINALISFLMIAAVVFFFIVQPINKLTAMSKRRRGLPEKDTRECPECLSDISRKASRCKFCGIKVIPLET